MAEATAGTDKVKSEKNANNSQSSLNFGALDNGDISSIVGTWTNANGESVTINADGTIIKNSTGYTAQLKPQGVSDNIFYAGVFSDTSSAALRAIWREEQEAQIILLLGQMDHIIVTSTKKIAIYELHSKS